MELSTEVKQYIGNVLKIAKTLDIPYIVFDNECVRGNHQDEGSMIIQREGKPQFPFTTMGIARIPVLMSRLGLLGSDVKIEAEERDRNGPTGQQQLDFVTGATAPAVSRLVFKLLLSKGRTKLDYKCADPALFDKIPRNLKDPPFFSFRIDAETVKLLQSMRTALDGEIVTLSGGKNGVVFKVSDTDGDQMDHHASNSVIYTSECDKEHFNFSYKNKILIPLLKDALVDDHVDIVLTRRGFLNLKVLGVNVYLTTEL
jgi:hypothetical protein